MAGVGSVGIQLRLIFHLLYYIVLNPNNTICISLSRHTKCLLYNSSLEHCTPSDNIVVIEGQVPRSRIQLKYCTPIVQPCTLKLLFLKLLELQEVHI